MKELQCWDMRWLKEVCVCCLCAGKADLPTRRVQGAVAIINKIGFQSPCYVVQYAVFCMHVIG